MIKDIKESLLSIPKVAWFILFGSLITSASFFMSLPFLALHLTQNLGLSPVMAGIVIGLGPCIGMFAVLWIGILADKWGRRRLIALACFTFGLAFIGFALSTEVWHFVIANLLFGLGRSTFRSNLSAFLTDIAHGPARKVTLQTQYYLINVGACMGPLAGAYFYFVGHHIAFFITGAVYMVYASFLTYLFFFSKVSFPKQKQSDGSSVLDTLTIMSKDRRLRYFIFGFAINFCAFVQFDTNFPQYMHQLFGDPGVGYFAKVISVNALTVITCQFVLLQKFKSWPTIKQIQVGVFLQGVGFLLFAIPTQTHYSFYFAMFVFTIGEILMVANGHVLIDEISPESSKSAYFSSFELANIGYILGPAIGGWILKNISGSALMGVTGMILIASILIFKTGFQSANKAKSADFPTA